MSVPAFIRRGLVLATANREAREVLVKWEEGTLRAVTFRNPRSLARHRAYFVMLNNVHEATGRWPSVEALTYDIALELKRGEFWTAPDGSVRFRPDSRRWASMSEEDFTRLFVDTEALLRTWGIDPAFLEEAA